MGVGKTLLWIGGLVIVSCGIFLGASIAIGIGVWAKKHVSPTKIKIKSKEYNYVTLPCRPLVGSLTGIGIWMALAFVGALCVITAWIWWLVDWILILAVRTTQPSSRDILLRLSFPFSLHPTRAPTSPGEPNRDSFFFPCLLQRELPDYDGYDLEDDLS